MRHKPTRPKNKRHLDIPEDELLEEPDSDEDYQASLQRLRDHFVWLDSDDYRNRRKLAEKYKKRKK